MGPPAPRDRIADEVDVDAAQLRLGHEIGVSCDRVLIGSRDRSVRRLGERLRVSLGKRRPNGGKRRGDEDARPK